MTRQEALGRHYNSTAWAASLMADAALCSSSSVCSTVTTTLMLRQTKQGHRVRPLCGRETSGSEGATFYLLPISYHVAEGAAVAGSAACSLTHGPLWPQAEAMPPGHPTHLYQVQEFHFRKGTEAGKTSLSTIYLLLQAVLGSKLEVNIAHTGPGCSYLIQLGHECLFRR